MSRKEERTYTGILLEDITMYFRENHAMTLKKDTEVKVVDMGFPFPNVVHVIYELNECVHFTATVPRRAEKEKIREI